MVHTLTCSIVGIKCQTQLSKTKSITAGSQPGNSQLVDCKQKAFISQSSTDKTKDCTNVPLSIVASSQYTTAAALADTNSVTSPALGRANKTAVEPAFAVDKGTRLQNPTHRCHSS